MLAASPAPWQVNPVPDPEAASPTGQTGGASRAVRGPQSLVRPQPTKQVTTIFFFPCCWFNSVSTSGNTYTLRKRSLG